MPRGQDRAADFNHMSINPHNPKTSRSVFLCDFISPFFLSLHGTGHKTRHPLFAQPTWQDRSSTCVPCQHWSPKSAGECLPKLPSISAVALSYVKLGPRSQLSSSTPMRRSIWFLFHSRLNQGAQCQLACLELFTHILHQSAVW